VVGVGGDLAEREPVRREGRPGPVYELGGDGDAGLGQLVDLADGEEVAALELVQPDPVAADGDDVERAVGMRLGLGELEPDAHPEQRLGAVVTDLVALADRDRPEQPLRRVVDPQQVVHERPVAVLEHVQRHGDAREHHAVQREHRQPVGHTANLAVRVAAAW
jgi:hypothetical protein